ncbi:hypothetical protein C8R45DRAFT_979436 [Mycena sanguinolenta]|nr:hypothetical protein C8R45DRAFT_979436 [Mycena sanguinolenta]
MPIASEFLHFRTLQFVLRTYAACVLTQMDCAHRKWTADPRPEIRIHTIPTTSPTIPNVTHVSIHEDHPPRPMYANAHRRGKSLVLDVHTPRITKSPTKSQTQSRSESQSQSRSESAPPAMGHNSSIYAACVLTQMESGLRAPQILRTDPGPESEFAPYPPRPQTSTVLPTHCTSPLSRWTMDDGRLGSTILRAMYPPPGKSGS